MALEVEDGTGKSTAESVISVTELDAWAVKLNWGTAWPAVGVSVPAKEAAAREATIWMESEYRPRISGFYPVSTSQALLFPVQGFRYPDGRYLASGVWLPREWAIGSAWATLEAYTRTLMPNLPRGGQVIEKTVGPLTTVWAEGAPAETTFQRIARAVAPLFQISGPIQAVRC